MSVKIIADSTCDLPEALLTQYDITILPLSIVKDGQFYRDRIEITPQDVFAHVDAGGALCSTAAVNVSEFTDCFAQYSSRYDAVICITLSAEMSSCYQNACLAAASFSNVYAVDSRNLSSAQGLIALDAARLAAEGYAGHEIVRMLNEETGKVQSSFLLDRLDYMRKGGRCSAVAALGANLMHLKPCIAVKDGKMGVVKKYRGSFEHCMVQYTKELLEHSPNSRGDIAIVVHPAADRAAVDATLLTLKEDGRFKAVYEARTGCTVACHCGANTIGVMFMTD
ncbi:MAG: DegV family protein [Candidatus Ventricola sp.]|nr:DegV family protein [Candidatus Ventricola sp.]MDY4855481.1 DegV family protein [Candidatus Ventricola sp.]